jgi:carboxyl-terminal processing protease
MTHRVPYFGIVTAVVAVAFAAGLGAGPLLAQNDQGTFRSLKLFGDVFERVRAEYVEDVGDDELIEAAISGMLTSLDPHSSYLNEDRYRDMQVQTRGEFGGLGIEVTMENGLVKVVSPIDETPAFRAGIEAGDLISAIDGEQVMGLSLGEAVELMRGAPNTDIALTILREGAEEPMEIELTRAVIKISPVRSRVERDVGYLRVTTFNEQTEDALNDAVDTIQAEVGDELRGVVLDLRNNPGGLLDQAVQVSDLFLDRGEVVSTRGRTAEEVQRFNARSGDVLDGLPMVVLINGGSASASEIVAGALQDHRRAIVMGTQSFGKGSVQTIMPVSGEGAIRLTTARYYTPAGTSIQATGIVPDIEVKQATLDIEDAERQARRESSLRGSLDNDQNRDGGDDERADLAERDYQLARAVDLLRGVSLFSSGDGRMAASN